MLCPWCESETNTTSGTCGRCGRTLPQTQALEETELPRIDRPCPPLGLLVLALGGTLTAVVVGLVYHLVSRYFDLYLFHLPVLSIYPVVVGFAVGIVLAAVAQQVRCRRLVPVLVIALFCGLLTYGVRLGVDGWYCRAGMIEGLVQGLAGDADTRKALRHDLNRSLGPFQTLTLFLLVQSEVGLPFGGDPPVTQPLFRLRGIPYVLFRLYEAGLLTAFVVPVALIVARETICPECKTAVEKETLFRTHPRQKDDLLQRVRSADWSGAAAVPRGGKVDGRNYCSVVLLWCIKCDYRSLHMTVAEGARTKTLLYAPVDIDTAVEAREVSRRET